ncbi:MAG: hypothetical protein Q7R66_14300 [Undibacterium sp.]|uniref:hypothetical protein n=1 Tax=Undibacterium sp. TaxID=1914977 RepID=UPI002719C567|nr:hypothetical protein [Undibacterium sp.]MDO8653353.1 hypothetical protein [Undibacterium sp.]
MTASRKFPAAGIDCATPLFLFFPSLYQSLFAANAWIQKRFFSSIPASAHCLCAFWQHVPANPHGHCVSGMAMVEFLSINIL